MNTETKFDLLAVVVFAIIFFISSAMDDADEKCWNKHKENNTPVTICD